MGTKTTKKKAAAEPRRGVFVGAYVPPELKEALEREASRHRRNTSNYLTVLLTDILLKKEDQEIAKPVSLAA